MNSLSSLQPSPVVKGVGRAEGRPVAATDHEFSYNAQDPVVLPTHTETLHGVTVGVTLSVEKDHVHLGDTLAPNAQGQYVFDAGDVTSLTAAISFCAVVKTIDTLSAALGHPVEWAFPGTLSVHPDNGPDFNAYYTRNGHAVNFFHGLDPKTHETIMSGASGEVVSHETGHAILDGLRPAYLTSWTPDVGAFHESFGDIVGILMALQDDASVALAARQTGGDLTKQNCIAATAEQLGIGINDKLGQNVSGGDYLRNAINDFTYHDPRLGSEVHDLSRLWTGAFYDVLVGVQARNMAAGMDAVSALRATGDEGLRVLANLLKEAPPADFTFPDMAAALLASDQKHNEGANQVILARALGGRLLMPATGGPHPAAAKSPAVRDFTVRLTGPGEYGQFHGAVVKTMVADDGSLARDAEVTQRIRDTVADLIAAGRIKYNDPNHVITEKDAFDPNGRPYIGMARWEDGQMIIERNPILS